MEVMTIKNSMINGQKAFDYGEWQGSLPCHWYSSKMILKPFERKNPYESNYLFK
jgi:hypothetical protein